MQDASSVDPLSVEPVTPGTWRAQVAPDQAQGRAAFGGLIVGLAARVMAPLAAGRAPRSFLTDFVGPVGPGAVDLVAGVLRAGRATTHVEVRVHQDGALAAVVLGVFGAARPTGLAADGPPSPAGEPEGAVSLPYLEGVTPTFTQHYEYRWGRGGFPFSGAPAAGFDGWIRPRRPVPVDAAGVLALLDAWPCPVLPMARQVVPASSVTWMVDFARGVPAAPTGAWWRFRYDAVVSAEGYVDCDGRLWAPDGGLVATSRQLVVEFSG